MGSQSEWEAILTKQGLSMNQGLHDWLIFTDDTDAIKQITHSRASSYFAPSPSEVVCPGCGSPFSPTNKRGFPASTCSDRCRKRVLRKKSQLIPSSEGTKCAD